MNEIESELDETWVRRRTGPRAIEEAKAIFRRVYNISNVRLRFRTAASIVCRGEVTIFGLDSPRFAIRAICDNKICRGSFVTLRLARLVKDRLQDVQWISQNKRNLKLVRKSSAGIMVTYNAIPEKLRPSPASAYQNAVNNRYVADCALVPPSANSYFLRADLGRQYGEDSPCLATSYVRSIGGFGGAACIQAAAFMSNAALADWPLLRHRNHYPPLISLGEVTLISKGLEEDGFLHLHGFGLRRIQSFFGQVGRASFIHKIHAPFDLMASVFTSHMLSGCPLLLKVSMHQILLTECRKIAKNHANELDHPHVLVVAEKSFNRASPKDFSLSVHDTSIRPFMNPSIQLLAEWMHAVPGSGGPWQFVSIYPEGVKLPLADFRTYDKDENSIPNKGIRTLAEETFRDVVGKQNSTFRRDIYRNIIGVKHWQLIEYSRTPGRYSPCEPNQPDEYQIVDVNDKAFKECWENAFDRLHYLQGKLCWLQVASQPNEDLKVVSLWSATQEQIEAFAHPDQLLHLMLFQIDKGGWTIIAERGKLFPHKFPRDRTRHLDDSALSEAREQIAPVQGANSDSLSTSLSAENSPRSDANSLSVSFPQNDVEHVDLQARISKIVQQYRVGLISSYRLASMEESLLKWPARSDNLCQLYVCPGKDPILEQSYQSIRTPKALCIALKTDPELLKHVTEKILQASDRSPQRPQIHSIASFLPGTNMLDGDLPVAGLIALADRLNNRSDGRHRVRLLPVVAGSRSLGLLPMYKHNPAEKPSYFQKIRSSKSTLQLLLRNLRKVVQHNHFGRLCIKNQIIFGIGLDPGPVSANNGLMNLEELTAIIVKRNDKLTPHLGLNIDIAHYEVAGINSEQFLHWYQKLQRKIPIVGIHLSDHGIGQTGDLEPGTMAFAGHRRRASGKIRLGVFRQWIRAIAECVDMAERDGSENSPTFDGVIMLELEAVAKIDTVVRSIEKIEGLLGETQELAVAT